MDWLEKIKTCRDCGETKLLEHFHNNRKATDGKQTECKPCRIAMVLEWKKANPEKFKQYCRITHLRKAYGIEQSEYDEMLAKQGGVCAICGGDNNKKKLAVDHDHDTGRIRGLLCCPCNRGLGKFRDNPAFLQKAIEYLEIAGL